MTNRRSFILALTAAALTPTVTFAADAGDIFGGILQGIKDRKEREWYEKHRDDGRWDGSFAQQSVISVSNSRGTLFGIFGLAFLIRTDAMISDWDIPWYGSCSVRISHNRIPYA